MLPALPGSPRQCRSPLRMTRGLDSESRLGQGPGWGAHLPSASVLPPPTRPRQGLPNPPHPTHLTGPGLTGTPGIHKTGWPQELETQETPGAQGPAFSGGLHGTGPPINICNSSPRSLLPKLLPGHLSQAPESAVELAVWTGPSVSMCIYNEFKCTYVKRSFLNICAFSLFPRLSSSPAHRDRGPGVGGGCGSLPGAFSGCQ